MWTDDADRWLADTLDDPDPNLDVITLLALRERLAQVQDARTAAFTNEERRWPETSATWSTTPRR